MRQRTVGGVFAYRGRQGRSAEELGLLAAFFTVLGDNLALLAVTRTAPEGGGACAVGDGTDAQT